MEIPDYIFDMVDAGQRIGYFEVFEEKREDELNFIYSEDEEYLIDDHYLIGSKPGSPEGTLYFINFGEGGKEPFTEFSVTISLGDFKYSVVDDKCGDEKVQRVMEHVLHARKDLVSAMKRRYMELRAVLMENR